MGSVVSIDGFRCQNVALSKIIVASGKFDVDNPCTLCGNRNPMGKVGPAFHYVEYGRWEFPFVAETNCSNFSLIAKPDVADINWELLDFAKQIHETRNRIAEVGRKYKNQWWALDPEEVGNFMGKPTKSGQVEYPYNLTGAEFYREVSLLRSDIFEYKLEIKNLLSIVQREWGIQNSHIAKWLKATSKNLLELSQQIDELEMSKETSPLSVFSKWAFNTVTGGAAWEGIKSVGTIIREILSHT